MEGKEAMKMEDEMGIFSFSDNIISEFSSEGDKNSSLGFVELLSIQDFGSSYPLFDMIKAPSDYNKKVASSSLSANDQTVINKATKTESPELMNQPTTPNSSSISSGSSEAGNEDQVKVEEQEEDQQKTKKQLKAKKTNQKRQREPRFAFMTKSEVDHLEDGYRWRKYGQKAVKDSPFPRSYYRCTTASCNVKKRVERSYTDPSIVVTTYEGQHTHPSPLIPRPSLVGVPPVTAVGSTFAIPMQQGSILPSYHHHHHHQLQQQQPSFVNNNNTLLPGNFGCNGTTTGCSSTNGGFLHEKRFYNCNPGAALLKDHGLLQDIVPSHMLKEN